MDINVYMEECGFDVENLDLYKYGEMYDHMEEREFYMDYHSLQYYNFLKLNIQISEYKKSFQCVILEIKNLFLGEK